MVSTDSITDMIVKIKNAASSGKETVVLPFSKKIFAIAQTLERAGYIEITPRKGKKNSKCVEAKIVYVSGSPKLKGVKRLSSVAKRVYKGIKSVVPVKNGYGFLILSTPKGVLTDKEAKKDNVGGEALFQIW